MKVIILLTLLVSLNPAFGQMKRDAQTNEIKYSEVVTLPELSKEEIYSRAKLWVVSTLKSGDNMVELSGSNSDQIVGTGNINLDSIRLTLHGGLRSKDAKLNFKFIVFTKEGRLKYSVENFSLTYKDVLPIGYVESGLNQIQRPQNVTKKKLNEFQQITEAYLDRKVNQLIANFVTSMQTTSDEDW